MKLLHSPAIHYIKGKKNLPASAATSAVQPSVYRGLIQVMTHLNYVLEHGAEDLAGSLIGVTGRHYTTPQVQALHPLPVVHAVYVLLVQTERISIIQ